MLSAQNVLGKLVDGYAGGGQKRHTKDRWKIHAWGKGISYMIAQPKKGVRSSQSRRNLTSGLYKSPFASWAGTQVLLAALMKGHVKVGIEKHTTWRTAWRWRPGGEEPAHSSARSRRSSRPARGLPPGPVAMAARRRPVMAAAAGTWVRPWCGVSVAESRFPPGPLLASPGRVPLPGHHFPSPHTCPPSPPSPYSPGSPSPLLPPLLSSPCLIIWSPSSLVIRTHFISPSTAQGCICLLKQHPRGPAVGLPRQEPLCVWGSPLQGEMLDGTACVWA